MLGINLELTETAKMLQNMTYEDICNLSDEEYERLFGKYHFDFGL